jgi:hypothetical protein
MLNSFPDVDGWLCSSVAAIVDIDVAVTAGLAVM